MFLDHLVSFPLQFLLPVLTFLHPIFFRVHWAHCIAKHSRGYSRWKQGSKPSHEFVVIKVSKSWRFFVSMYGGEKFKTISHFAIIRQHSVSTFYIFSFFNTCFLQQDLNIYEQVFISVKNLIYLVLSGFLFSKTTRLFNFTTGGPYYWNYALNSYVYDFTCLRTSIPIDVRK